MAAEAGRGLGAGPRAGGGGAGAPGRAARRRAAATPRWPRRSSGATAALEPGGRARSLREGHERLGLSGRGWDRAIRVARTIADLGGRATTIGEEHVAGGAGAAPQAERPVSGAAASRGLRRVPAPRWLVASLSAQIERGRRRPARQPRPRAARRSATPELERRGGRADAASVPATARASATRPGCARRSRGAHAWACCRHHDAYPAAAARPLRRAGGPVRPRRPGAPGASSAATSAVTVVGARRPSAYGREMATRLGRELASAGLVVVSGMALGIDSCAHRGRARGRRRSPSRCSAAGRTCRTRPRMRGLYERIVERGLVLTELPPGPTPRRWTFPARNRIMAALGAMTIVVEARERSGSLITAGDRRRPRPRGRRGARARSAARRPAGTNAPAPRRRPADPRRPGRARLAARAGRGRPSERASEPRRGPSSTPT